MTNESVITRRVGSVNIEKPTYFIQALNLKILKIVLKIIKRFISQYQ